MSMFPVVSDVPGDWTLDATQMGAPIGASELPRGQRYRAPHCSRNFKTYRQYDQQLTRQPMGGLVPPRSQRLLGTVLPASRMPLAGSSLSRKRTPRTKKTISETIAGR